eukprot:g485.t1
MVSLLLYVPNPSMKALFAALGVLYVFNVVIFLLNIDEDIFTFLFSTVNWNETLREELWKHPIHGSSLWGVPELIGDTDARHAAHVLLYKKINLPWDKITSWLRAKKATFLQSPPLWMTPKWFDRLPSEVKRDVWTEPGELDELIRKCAETIESMRDQREIDRPEN